MKFLLRRHISPLFFTFMMSFGLIGCATADPDITPTATSIIQLTSYRSPTPSQQSTKDVTQVRTSTPAPTLTPTPITYTIVEGDTMLAIALRNGITFEELQKANPDVNPRLLSVGTELVIPLGGEIPPVPMTPTPLPLDTNPPVCYPVQDGIWCFLLVTNDRSRPLENLSAQMILLSPEGRSIAEAIAIAPLNQLKVDEDIPLTVFFPGDYPPEFSVIASLMTAQFTPRGDDRYLNAWIEVDQVMIIENGLAAQVEGTFGLPKKSSGSDQVWILATAYNQQGEVVGFRRLEENETLSPGSSKGFTLEIFSLGPQIKEVEVLIEARPQSKPDQAEDDT